MSVFTFILIIICYVDISYGIKPDYCTPMNDTCWPSSNDINEFGSTLSGELIESSLNNTEYLSYINMTQDLLYRYQYPSFIVLCNTVSDIKNSVLFASKYNIQITILSTGHSWSGISTGNYSLQINLSNMTKYEFSDDNNTITVETGLKWGEIYNLVSDRNKIIVGGADQGVGPGGYTLGGGHSPLSPYYGLSSDYTTEYYMVDGYGNIVHVYNTSGVNSTIDDMFWALKGGGGGTFGVIINITIALHDIIPEAEYTELVCEYSWYQNPIQKEGYIGDIILDNFFNIIKNKGINATWGGYILVSETDVYTILLIYYGNSTYARNDIQPMLSLNYPYNNSFNSFCQINIYDTFQEISQQIPSNEGGFYTYVMSNLIPSNNITSDLSNTIASFLNVSHNDTSNYYGTLTLILLGGKCNERSDNYTAVHPGFRNSAFEISPTITWFDSEYNNDAVSFGQKWELNFNKYGYGKYINEENYDCIDCNWTSQFWGNNNYNKLKDIKMLWDPNQVFWCHHCVGDN